MSVNDLILVTGASGQLGRKVVRRLIELGYPVRAHFRSLEKAARWCPREATPVLGDLTEPGWLPAALKGCDYVIHCAAKVSLRPADLEPMRQINVGGTQAVIEACKQNGIKRLVHVSSVAALGASEDGRPIDETAPFNLAGYGIPYFETKHESERLALEANGGYLEVVVVEPSIIIAPPDREVSVEEWAKMPKRIPAYFDFGLNVVEAADVVNGIILALQKGIAGQRYILAGENIGPERAFELADKYLGMKRPFFKIPRWGLYLLGLFSEIAYAGKGKKPRLNRSIARLAKLKFYYSSAKANRELGWIATPLENTIERIVAKIPHEFNRNIRER
jgi:dihydroflavonol-4-reductase